MALLLFLLLLNVTEIMLLFWSVLFSVLSFYALGNCEFGLSGMCVFHVLHVWYD